MKRNGKRKNKLFNLTFKTALERIDIITEGMQKRNYIVKSDSNIIVGQGKTIDTVGDEPQGYVGTKYLSENDNIFKNKRTVSDKNFVTCVIATFHEQRHVQLAKNHYQNSTSDPDLNNALLASYIAKQNNYDYYMENRTDFPTEIDAEFYGIYNAYRYLVSEFPEIDPHAIEQVVVDYVNDRTQNATYQIKDKTTKIESMDDIEQAFNKAMQESISTRQRIYRLNQKSNDESAKILNQPEWSKITDKIYDEHNGHTKDKMIASVVVYKHPDYNKKLLNSSTLDLSPASLFGCEFPDSLATQRAAQAALELNSSDFENNGAEY